jgi:arginyl-tRNA synthetase
MSLVARVKEVTAKAIEDVYKIASFADDILVNQTKPEFEGDYTVVLFSLVKKLKKAPEVLGKELGENLINNNAQLFKSYNVIKGFLNLVINDAYYIDFLFQQPADLPATGKKIMVEYSSPNTNKPLHLGHLRNIFLGWSMAEIFKATGNTVMKTAVVNDRGIHICKSMLAWQQMGNG